MMTMRGVVLLSSTLLMAFPAFSGVGYAEPVGTHTQGNVHAGCNKTGGQYFGPSKGNGGDYGCMQQNGDTMTCNRKSGCSWVHAISAPKPPRNQGQANQNPKAGMQTR